MASFLNVSQHLSRFAFIILLWSMGRAAPLNAEAGFDPSPMGCSLNQCDASRSSILKSTFPKGALSVLNDTASPFSRCAACVSNGSTIACVVESKDRATQSLHLAEFDSKGIPSWVSSDALVHRPGLAPSIASDGVVVIADAKSIFRLSAKGKTECRLELGNISSDAISIGKDRVVVATSTAEVRKQSIPNLVLVDLKDCRVLSTLALSPQVSRAATESLTTRYLSYSSLGHRLFALVEPDNRESKKPRAEQFYAMAVNVGAELSTSWTVVLKGIPSANPMLLPKQVLIPAQSGGPRIFSLQDKEPNPMLSWTARLACTDCEGSVQLMRDPSDSDIWAHAGGSLQIEKFSRWTGERREEQAVTAFLPSPQHRVLSSRLLGILFDGTNLVSAAYVRYSGTNRSLAEETSGDTFLVGTHLRTRTSAFLARLPGGTEDGNKSTLGIAMTLTGQPLLVLGGIPRGPWMLGEVQ